MDNITRNIEYLTEVLNDTFNEVGKCEDVCPYHEGCNILIHDAGISLCGAIQNVICAN